MSVDTLALIKRSVADLEIQNRETILYIESLEITTPEQKQHCDALVILVQDALKEAEAELKEAVAPDLEHEKAVRAIYKPIIEKLTNGKKKLKDALGAWHVKQTLIAAEKQAELDKAVAGGKVTNIQIVAAPEKTTTSSIGSVTMVDHWETFVFDFALLPDKYKLANMAAINDDVDKKDGLRNIPGCKIEYKPIPRTSRSK